jgi:hypothetical protein
VAGRNYYTRQAATLLKIAQSTSDPRLAAAPVERASNFLGQIDDLSEAGPKSANAGFKIREWGFDVNSGLI